MPPTSSIRKTSSHTMTIGAAHPNNVFGAPATNEPHPRRTTASGRAIRANTTRPANYYARPFGPIGTAVDQDADVADSLASQPPGFFPALQYFTDAITALPKEVMKQFTLMKEVEAKIYGPNEQLGEIIDSLMEYPVPPCKPATDTNAGASTAQGLLTLTANNSTSGSANASMINGVLGRHSAQPSLNESLVDGEPPVETDEERKRRHQYQEMRVLTHSLLANLDEKNVVLAEANRVLGLQHTRLDSVWPHVEEEISEEARLGSMSHWAYSDNRVKTKATAAGAQNRRDVAATNSLAAAANMLHETEIAQARREAGREAAREKAKGKRIEHAGDSDFDDKPRKAAKLAKSKAAGNAGPAGLGILGNGELATGRKGKKAADKEMAATGMVRTVSSQGKAAKGRETPRSTPAIELAAKKPPKTKPGPPKKKVPASAHNSPMLASSPLASSFNPSTIMEPPGAARPQSARIRQHSSTTNLRHERIQDEDSNDRPGTATSKTNGDGERLNGRRKVHETTEIHEDNLAEEQTESQLKEVSETLKREDTDMPDAKSERTRPGSRSRSNSRKGSGRGSKVSTPRQDSYHSSDATATARIRLTRRKTNPREESSSEEPQLTGTGIGKHSRNLSNSHLVKQLAPFNKSPDLDRHRNRDDMEEDLDSLEGNVLEEEPEPEDSVTVLDRETRRSSTRRPLSRRNTVNTLRSSPAPMSQQSSPPASPPPTNTRISGRATAAAREAAAREAEAAVEAEVEAEAVEEEDEEEDSEHDPDDPNEPKYCYCNRGSYGEMVACDNENCPREWFHLGCTELREAPSEDEKWYCRECKPAISKVGRKGKTGRGGRGG